MKIEEEGVLYIHQDSLSWLAEQGLTGEEYKVLFAIMARVKFACYTRISQTDIAEKLNIARSSVSRAVKRLLELNILIEGPRADFCKTYMVNPYMGLEEEQKPKQKQAKIVDYAEAKTSLRKQKPDADAPKPEE